MDSVLFTGIVHSAPLLTWREKVKIPHAVSIAVQNHSKKVSGDAYLDLESRQVSSLLSELLVPLGISSKFIFEDTFVVRDRYGKPSLFWGEASKHNADIIGIQTENVYISNTNDGGTSLYFAGCDADLLGVGIDIVSLDRLRCVKKNREYLLRFAHHFMSQKELELFNVGSDTESIESLRCRVAAHFSLMESISKALGTGLKIGAGMGRSISLPKQSIGISRLQPDVAIIAETPVLERMYQLGANSIEAHWGADNNFMVSAALLWK